MSDVEKELIKMFDGSKPVEEELFETSNVNQLAWTLVVVFTGIILWLCVALINAENQRNALATGQCADPVFKGQVDQRCMMLVRSRDHWWQHLWYGMSHVRPATPPEPGAK